MNSTRRRRQTTGSGAYRGSQGSQPSATDYTEWLAPAPSHNKWQRWSYSRKILDTRTSAPGARARARTHTHTRAACLQHLALAWNLVFAANPHRDPSSSHPLSCLHLLCIWGPHHGKCSHTENTFNLLPAKCPVIFPDFFFIATFISAPVLRYTLSIPLLMMTTRYRGRF